MALTSLQLRLVSALVLIPVTVGIILYGGWLFMAIMALAFVAAGAEWIHLVRGLPRLRVLAGGLGLIYMAACFVSYIWMHRYFPNGPFLCLMVMVSVWGSDSAAYMFGKVVGGPKWVPAISPNKTWAGLAGAILGCGATMAAMAFIGREMSLPFSLVLFGVIGLGLGFAGQIGDITESWFKRLSGHKDSGHLIPGHGGLLDRIDALMIVALLFFILIWSVMP